MKLIFKNSTNDWLYTLYVNNGIKIKNRSLMINLNAQFILSKNMKINKMELKKRGCFFTIGAFIKSSDFNIH